MLSNLNTVAGEALCLIYFRRLTQGEAADALGIPRAAIGQYVVHGMRALAGQLQATLT
jgi:DNA-directed RNA polymerase specialized sigma24 family protein